MLKFPPCTFNTTREMLKVQFGILWTCPRTREMLNMLNMLKVSPNYEPQGLIVRKTQKIEKGGIPHF